MAALAATSAFAQSSVTVSGQLVLGFGTTKIGAASSGPQIIRNTGNLQFAGTEDLGGGLKAGFQVQTTLGIPSTNNTVTSSAGEIAYANQKTILGDRAANLTLSGGFGTIGIGNGNTGIRSTLGTHFYSDQTAVTSALSASSSAAAVTKVTGTYVVASGDANARILYGDTFGNAFGYTSPTINGFSASVAISPVMDAETNVGDNATRKDTISLSLNYANGPISAGYNLTDVKGTSTPHKVHTLAASYNLGVAKIGIAHQAHKLDSGVNPGTAMALSVGVPLGSGIVGAGYGKRGASASALAGDDVKQAHIGYRYNLSKRSNIQAVYNNIDRATATNTDIKEVHILMNHTF